MSKRKFERNTAGNARDGDVSGNEPVIISAPRGAEIEKKVRGAPRQARCLNSNSKALNVFQDEELSDNEVTEAQVKISERCSRNCVQLQFRSELPDVVWTGDSIKGEDKTALEVALVDSLTGQVVKTGPEAFAEVKIVALQATFDDDDWTHEAFKQNIVTKWEGTDDSLLCGTKSLNLSGGIGTIHVNFTHRSGWKKIRKYRLGAITEINFHGTRVREAKTQRFTVKDKRMLYNGKHKIPALSDEVWRLQNIAKGRPLCKHLREKNIETVQKFLTEYFLRPQNLEKILSPPMSKKQLDQTVQHALKCELDGKYFYQSGSSQQKTGVVFNIVGQLRGVFSEGHYYAIDKLSQMEKGKAHELVVSAFEQWEKVVSFNKTSVCAHSSGLSNVLPSNSPRLENPSGNGNGTYHMTDQYGSNAPQDNCFMGIVSPSNFSPCKQDNDASQKIDEYDSTQQSNSSLGIFPVNNPSPSGHDDEISHMIDGHGILPCDRTMGNISSYNLHRLMSGLDDFEVSDMEMKYAYLGCPNQELYSCVSLESMIADFDSEFALKSWEKIKRVLAFRRKMIVKRRSEKAECP